MSSKSKIGKLGEKLACQHLNRHGYKIIGNNFRIKSGEIDIICQKNEKLVFVEVKTRTSLIFGFPEEAFDGRKQARFNKAVNRYLVDKEYNKDWQIDLIAIQIKKSQKKAYLRHFQAVEMDNY